MASPGIEKRAAGVQVDELQVKPLVPVPPHSPAAIGDDGGRTEDNEE
jgi:hypothetical protein